jgi:hypothetical protein
MARARELQGAGLSARFIVRQQELLEDDWLTPLQTRERAFRLSAARAAANATEQPLLWACENRAGPETDTGVAASNAVAEYARQVRRRPEEGARAAAWAELKEQSAQCAVLRDLVGNPFQFRAVESSWLTQNDGAVRELAQVIGEGQAFDRLPILADALEDAGCTDAAILEHCRGPSPHVRGCWVVDAILGRQ